MINIKIGFLLLGFLLTGRSRAQESQYSEKPVEVNLTYLGDIVTNYSGGIKRGTQYLGLFNLRITFNTEAAGLWKGGQFFVNCANAHGGDPSVELIGDYHVASNIETSDITYLHELFYRHSFGNFKITTGLQELNSEFISTTFGNNFLNSSFGTPSTIANNIPSPIFPLTALGITMQWEKGQNMMKLALFDGLPTEFSDNPYNLRWKLDDEEGVFATMEYSRSVSITDHKGQFRAGVYYHSHFSEADPDFSTSDMYNYNYGIYLIADQIIWKNSKDGNIGLFQQIAASPGSINNQNIYVGTGLTFNGLVPGRTEDFFGIAYCRTETIDHSDKEESALEFSYRAQFRKNLFIQPDFQYIMNPCGTSHSLKNAFTGLIRIGVNL